MGSSESGHLAVQVDTRNIQAGSEITGVVHFQLRRQIRAESLVLKLAGTEYCYWEETSTKTDSDGAESTITTEYKGESTVVEQLCPLFLFQDSQVMPGQYSFPFRLFTASSLPGSFEYTSEATTAHIRYHISAFLYNSHANIKCVQTSICLTPRMSEAIVGLQDSASARICTWCCLGKGEVQLDVRVDKSAYVPGATAYVEVDVDNSRSRLDLLGIKAGLSRTIRLRANDGSTHINRRKISRGFSGQVVAAGQGSTTLHLSLAIPHESTQNLTSLRGQHIECQYTFSVRATLDGLCMWCGRPPSMSREVTIYPVQLSAPELPQAPVDWNPLVMPLVQFWSAPEYN